MCGRFVQFSSLRTLAAMLPLEEVITSPRPSYNIAPTQMVAAIINRGGCRLEALHWGLVPAWAKDLSGASRLINARAETVAQKPSFRVAFRKRRCLIVADGFYEWKGASGRKQPWFLRLPSRNPFAFAGLYESWKSGRSPHKDPPLTSCAIITTAAGGKVREIHHRMPVILDPRAYARWLDPALQDPAVLAKILAEECITELEAYQVSRAVNRVAHNAPDCMEPLAEAPAE